MFVIFYRVQILCFSLHFYFTVHLSRAQHTTQILTQMAATLARLAPSTGPCRALARSLNEGPVNSDVLAQQVRAVQLVPGLQRFLVRFVLNQGVALQETWNRGMTVKNLFDRKD